MKKLLLCVIGAFLLSACQNSSNKQGLTSADMMLEEAPPSPPKLPKKYGNDKVTREPGLDTTTAGKPSPGASTEDWDKKIIKTANLKLEVKDFKEYATLVHKAARQYGGYVASEAQSESADKIESAISIKVPVDQFEQIMLDLPLGAIKTIERTITTEDVTGEIVDTKSRLESKRQMRLKYLEFLKQSKNITEVLQVQKEIDGIQEEVESASARINYLSHQAAYSTVNLTFYQAYAGYDPNDNPGFLSRLAQAFRSGFAFTGELLIGIISIWPILLLIIAGWLVLKKRIMIVTSAKQKL